MKDSKRILYVSPHLSTGGLPQYLLKKIESFNNIAEVFCVEYNFLGDAFVVQRNNIKNILNDRFISLSNSKEEILSIIKNINPDIIHFEEIPETFIPNNILKEIYAKDRNYFICETCHSSVINPNQKIFMPDKFIMVSEWIALKFSILNTPYDILEYPIENLVSNKKYARDVLNLDPNYKHVINIGLFTEGKNQKELIEYAKVLEKYNIQFHFIGNQADNFIHYWKPLMKDLPNNCKIWGERADTHLFYQAADLFVFTSKFELNPLCIKESLSYKTKVLMYNLDTYINTYENNDMITFLDKNNKEENLLKILNLLNINVK